MLKLDKLDISDVRKSLYEIREKFKKKQNSIGDPIYLSDKLSNGMTLEEFCYRFSLASHIRRHQKSNTFKTRHYKTDNDSHSQSPRDTHTVNS